jgi:hypothetical protein
MNKNILVMFSTMLFSLNLWADCTSSDMSLLGFVPSVIDFNTSNSVTTDFQVSHSAFTGVERCYFFGFVDYGSALNWSTRYLTHTTSGTTIPFNVYSSGTFTNNSRVRLASDAANNRHVMYESPLFFNPSGTTQTLTRSFYSLLGALPTNLPPGLYTESLIFRVGARLTNPPFSDYVTFPFVLSRAVQFIYNVDKELSLSLVATGGVFDPFSTSRLLSFGELESGESRTADIIIKTNVGYRLRASSQNNGRMQHSSGAIVNYNLLVSGAVVNLAGSAGSPALISSNASNSPALGFTLPLQVEVGSLTGAEPGGDYTDSIRFTIEAF